MLVTENKKIRSKDSQRLISPFSDTLDRAHFVDTQRAFAKSELWIRPAMASAGIIAWKLDIATGALECSESRGLLDREALDRGFVDHIHPMDRVLRDAAINRAIHNHSPYSLEYRLVLPDGFVWIMERVSIETDSEGRAVQLVGICTDIGDVRRRDRHTLEDGMSTVLDCCEHRNGVAVRAHQKWLKRTGRNHVDDWLEAEAELADCKSGSRFKSGDGGASAEQQRITELIHHHDEECRLAREIQQQLLPKAGSSPPGLLVSGRSVPSSRAVGGDYFDYFSIGDGSLGLAIGDASGHGIGSALIITETRAYVRALSLTSTNPAEILQLTNRRLAQDLSIGHFVTLFLARLDLSSRLLQYAGAGHCPGYVLGPAGVIRATLRSEGLPLGIDSTFRFPAGPIIQLEQGDLIFLYTDGVPEAGVSSGQQFGIERALDCLRLHRQESLDGMLESLFNTISDFSGPAEQLDDITALLIQL